MGADLYVPCSHGTSQLVAFVGEVVESTTFPLAQHIPAELSSPLPQSFGMLAALQAVRGARFPCQGRLAFQQNQPSSQNKEK